MKGIPVAPLSRLDIQKKALQIRIVCGLQNDLYLSVIKLLEHDMMKIYPNFNYEYVDSSEIGNNEGLMLPREHTVVIPNDVLYAAARGDGRSRFTIAHEIGYYILHRDQTTGFARNSCVERHSYPVFRDSEWQANTLAAEILMPAHLIKELSIPEIMKECQVSRHAAECQMNKLNEIKPFLR